MPPKTASGDFYLVYFPFFLRTQCSFLAMMIEVFKMCFVMSRMWSGADGKYVSDRGGAWHGLRPGRKPVRSDRWPGQRHGGGPGVTRGAG